MHFDAAAKIGLPEKIEIGLRNGAHFLVGLHFLNIGFDDGSVGADTLHLLLLAQDGAVNHLVESCGRMRGVGGCGRRILREQRGNRRETGRQ